MDFILTLATFLFIVIGLIMILGCMPSNRKNTLNKLDYYKQSYETRVKINVLINKLYLRGVWLFILGIGIIVARVFS